jgi:hypothetical protein
MCSKLLAGRQQEGAPSGDACVLTKQLVALVLAGLVTVTAERVMLARAALNRCP